MAEENIEKESIEQELKNLQKKFAQCEKEREEYLEGWQRSRADFHNYIKQKNYEIEQSKIFANVELIFKIVSVLDNLDSAAKAMPEEMRENSWAKGILSIKKHFENVLKDEGVERLTMDVGSRYDPALAEAIEEVESGKEGGMVVEIIEPGYAMHGRVIRPARVRVSK